MRLQLALNVRDIEEAVAYYSKLFDTKPHKQRAGYANFAIAQPPLKLVLFENPGAQERLNHIGVEVLEAEQLEVASERLLREGILDKTQHNETCCHATQNKLWSIEPQGLHWEWYQITDDNPREMAEVENTRCCAVRRREEVCCNRATV